MTEPAVVREAPWTCARCGWLVSARVPHGRGRACTPPAAFEPHTVLASKDPPFQAWPSGHVHKRAGRLPYLTSPVHGVAASALVALARQQSSNPRAPTWQFRRLLEAAPELVQAEIASPAATVVACSAAHHRLELRDGMLHAPDHAGLDVDSELIAAALGGASPSRCLSLVAAWRAREVVALRRAGLWQLLILGAARRWSERGDSAERRDAWTGRGLGPQDLDEAAQHGLSDQELVLWFPVAHRPVEIVAWRDSGWTVREAQALAAAGVPAPRAGQWRQAGLDVARTKEALTEGLGPEQASDWYTRGWPVPPAGEAVAAGLSVDELEALVPYTGRRTATVALARSGVTPAAVDWWVGRGHGVKELVIMASDGMDLSDLTVFARP